MKKFICLSILFIVVSNSFGQWVKTSGPDPDKGYVDCFAMTGPYLFAGTYGHGGVYLTSNNGDTWTDMGVDNEYIHALVFQGTNLFVGTEGGVFLSMDTAQSWYGVSEGLSHPLGIQVSSLAAIGDQVFAGTFGGFYRSIDTGMTWSQYGIFNFDGEFNTMAVIGQDICGGGYGSIGFSNDSGKNWSGFTEGIDSANTNAHEFAFDGEIVYVATYCSGIFRRPVNGSLWNNCSRGIHDSCVNSIIIKGNVLFASMYDGVYISTNKGNSWRQVNEGLLDTVVLRLTVNDKYIFAATDSSGVWRRPLSDFGINVVKENTSSSKITISPNPTTGIITIRNTLENLTSITIFNILGEKVIELLKPNAGAFEIDISKLPVGIYYARFITEVSAFTEKILKQ